MTYNPKPESMPISPRCQMGHSGSLTRMQLSPKTHLQKPLSLVLPFLTGEGSSPPPCLLPPASTTPSTGELGKSFDFFPIDVFEFSSLSVYTMPTEVCNSQSNCVVIERNLLERYF